MPPVDYPGARQRLYVIRELQNQAGAGYLSGRFLGIYRDHTPEAAILTARNDHPASFARGPVSCTDLSAWARLVSFEATLALIVVLHPCGRMDRGHLHPGSRVVQAAQQNLQLRRA